MRTAGIVMVHPFSKRALQMRFSAVSHNPNTLDGCFRLIVRKKHLRWAHVGVISILRYPSAQLPRPNQERMCCGGRGGETFIFYLRAALSVAVAESTPPSDVPWHGNESAVGNRSPAPQNT